MEDMLKGVDKRHSVFNRKDVRKQKKLTKKIKKSDYFLTTKDEKWEKLKEDNKRKYEEAEAKALEKKIVKPVLSQEEKEKQRKEVAAQKAEQKKKQAEETEKKLMEERIKLDDEEIKYFEKILGKNKNSKAAQRRYKKEFEGDGWGDDFLGFLDNISATVQKDVNEYKPYFEQEGLINDEEIDQLVVEANAPISLAAGAKKTNKAAAVEEEEEDNSDQVESGEEDYMDEEEEQEVGEFIDSGSDENGNEDPDNSGEDDDDMDEEEAGFEGLDSGSELDEDENSYEVEEVYE